MGALTPIAIICILAILGMLISLCVGTHFSKHQLIIIFCVSLIVIIAVALSPGLASQ